MKNTVIIEGNLSAVKDTGDFGGVNMWNLHVKKVDGRWESVQWMSVHCIQAFFKEELPRYYKETTSKVTRV